MTNYANNNRFISSINEFYNNLIHRINEIETKVTKEKL